MIILIRFVERRVLGLFQRLNITEHSPVYDDFMFLHEHWLHVLENTSENNIDLVCEGLLLYSLSYLCIRSDEETKDERTNTILWLNNGLQNIGNVLFYSVILKYIPININTKTWSLWNLNISFAVDFEDWFCQFLTKFCILFTEFQIPCFWK